MFCKYTILIDALLFASSLLYDVDINMNLIFHYSRCSQDSVNLFSPSEYLFILPTTMLL